MKTTSMLRWLLLTMVLAGNARAATKVMLYLSPFGKGAICMDDNGTYGYYYVCSDSATYRMKLNSHSWMEYDFSGTGKDTVLNDNIVLNHSSDGSSNDFQSVSFNPYALFKTHDTVWIVPDPYPSGKGVKLLTSTPKTKVVMFWNPWISDTVAPTMKLASFAWSTTSSNPTLPGWYTGLIVGYDSLTLVFKDSTLKQYFGKNGLSATDSTEMDVDSIGRTSDTIWIRGTPEVSPTKVVATASQPADKVIMLFNPWNGVYPVQHPQATIGGNGPYAMHANANYCGWYSFSYFDRTPTVLFTNQKTKATFGKTGIGSTTPIDLSALSGDTAWISVSNGSPSISTETSDLRGVCEVSYLAATIRDFPSDGTNHEFARGSGCQRGGWGLVKGMVDSILGADRKPVRSPYDTGWNGIRNSWGGYDYGYRCTYDTVEPASKAEIGDTGLATSWFKTVEGKNAETCRDIVLTLDSTGSYYVNNSPYFFPIDDFSRLSNGAANPYYDQIRGGDGKLHNFGFCMESHGDFEYKKGQTFHFAGDDDVWFFINNRLVVDLGGIHSTSTDSVRLDSMGLVEGTTYPFDFFFCERDPSGSDMMIQTTMNLRTNSSFRVVDSTELDTVDGSHHYYVKVSITTGQGCRAVTKVARTTALIKLTGPSFSTAKQLSTGTWYGGISIDSAAGTARIDSASISGLAAGTYTITFVSTSDSTSVRKITFVVPYTVGPEFTNRHSVAKLVGDTFAVAVGAFNESGIDSSSIPFRVRSSGGLAFYSDSLLTKPVSATDTLKTGIDGKSRHLWALATAVGTWTIVIGSGDSDTADTWTDVVVQARKLSFTDSTRKKLDTVPAVVLYPGQGYHVHMGLYIADTLCTSCTGTVKLSVSNALLILSSTNGGGSIDSASLAKGILDFWVRGTAALDSGSLTAVLKSDTSAHATWTPITIAGWKLKFLADSTKTPLTPLPAVVLDPDESYHMRLGLFMGDTLCTSCTGTVKLSSAQSLLTISSTSGGTAVASATLASGYLDFWVRGSAAFDSASLLAVLSSDTTVRATWTPISVVGWRLRFVYGTTVSDTLIPIDQLAGTTASVTVQVWGRAAACTTCTGTLTLSASGTGIVFQTTAGVATTSATLASGKTTFLVYGSVPTTADTLHIAFSSSGATLQGYPVTFRVAPPDSARMYDADGDGRADSLVVHLHQAWATDNAIEAAWPDSLPQVPGRSTRILDSTTVAVLFSSPFGADKTAATHSFGLYSWDGSSSWESFPIADGVAPVPVEAWLSWGDGISTPDTLRTVVSEPSTGSVKSALVRLGNGTGVPDQADTRRISVGGDTLVLLWAPASIATCPRPGDSLGLASALSDLAGNAPGSNGKKVAIQGTARPPKDIVYLDSDGDGRIDAARVDLLQANSGTLPTFDLSLPGPSGTETRTGISAERVSGDSLTLTLSLPSPFPFGWTSFPAGKWAKVEGGAAITTLDGAGPVIDTAYIRHTETYDGDDTLLVLPSEALSGTPLSSWFSTWIKSTATEGVLPSQTPGRLGDTLVIILYSSSSDGVSPGDSIRWTAPAADTSGNAASTRWRPIGGSPRPAYLRLSNPTPLFTPTAASTQSTGSLEFQVYTSGAWTGWGEGSATASSCDSVACSGPTLEINQALTLDVHLYDLLGVHVASTRASVDPASLPTDRLGRVRVRILWNGKDDQGAVAADGIYLLRLIIHAKDSLGRDKVENRIWKIGLTPGK